MRIVRYLCAALAVLVLFVGQIQAQSQRGIPTDGRDFYIAYVAPSIKCAAVKPFQATFAILSSYYSCTVTMNYFDANGKEIAGHTYRLLAKNATYAPLDLSYMDPKDANGNRMNIDGEVPMYTACHIHADYPISVAYYSTGPNSGGMYCAFQTGALGKKYVVAAAPANPAQGAANSHHFACTIDSASSEFAVLAIKDNTQVTITPTTTTRNLHRVGVNTGESAWGQPDGKPHPFVVTLNRGQVYWVKSALSSEEYDMSGSIVESDQPVGVIGACESMFNGTTQYAGYGGDQRDLSCEMMVPVEYWTSDGYVAMPFMDGPGTPDNDPSTGDLYKVYTYDPTGTTISFNIDQVGARTKDVNRLQNPPVQFDNVQTGISCGSQSGQKIMVEQYDYRAMFNEPYPAPSQTNIIPIDRFRTAYVWGVPDDALQVHKKRYINVIANRNQFSKIKISHDGKGAVPLTSLPAAGQTASIPGYPQLQGRRYEIQPGGYFAQGDSAFALYQYGDLGLDPDFDLGDNDDDDYYFSYASICGQSFGIDGAYTPSLKVDTVCNGWTVHVHDGNPLDQGIAQVEILKDPLGILKRKPGTDSGYISSNCSFDPPNFVVIPGDTAVTFHVKVDNPLQDADGWFWVLNVAGNDTLVHVHYKAPHLSFLPDSAAFYNSQIGIDTCTHFTFKNLGKTGELSFNVTGLHWLQGGQGVRLTSTVPPLPYNLKPGDSIIFNVCFNASTPAHVYLDTMVVETDCPTPIAAVIGTTTTPEIQTEDWDFGAVLIGQTKCHPIRVWNSGKAPFTLTKQWVLDNHYNFSFADTGLLPLTIKPGETVTLNFCYSPSQDTAKDSTVQHWSSDIPEPFTHTKKDYSVLKGSGIKPSLSWDRLSENITTECDHDTTFRAYLRDLGTAGILVDSVYITGPTKNEWTISRTQSGKPATQAFAFNPEDSAWYEFHFVPDLSKPLPQRWADRVDTVWAHDADGIFPLFVLNLNIIHAEIGLSTQNLDLGSSSPGVPTATKTITVTNTGAGAPLIIDSLMVDQPFTIVQPGSLKVGDTIMPGKSGTIILQGLMATAGTDTGNLYVRGLTHCPLATGIVTMSTAFVSVQATGKDYGVYYICQNKLDSVMAVSKGSRDVNLLGVTIVDAAGAAGESNEFQFAGGTRTLAPNVLLKRNQAYYAGIQYIPTMKKSVSAWVVFTFDTVGDISGVGKWNDTVLITGTGLQEHQTVSLANPVAGPYIAQTGSAFSVPIQLTESISPNADVHAVTMDITYRRDLFQLASTSTPVSATAGYQVVSASVSDNAAAGTETVTVTLAPSSGGSFSSSAVIGNLNLQLMVARDTNSVFAINNVSLTDSRGVVVCWVLHDTLPGAFTPMALCGDALLRRFMTTGELAFSIGEVRPNPATTSVHVDMNVRKDGMPMTIELYNVLGQKVRTFTTEQFMHAGARQMDLDLTGIAAGSYSLRVTTPETTKSAMLLIQH